MKAATVLVFGTFDGLHPGHEDYFRQAAAYGGRIVAVVARDRTVLDVKGQLPRLNEEQRRAAVEAHELVDCAVLGQDGDKLRVICELKPDVVLLGYDQQAFTEGLEEALQKRGLNCRVMRAAPYRPETFKSSLLFGGETPLVTSGAASLVETEPVKDWLPI